MTNAELLAALDAKTPAQRRKMLVKILTEEAHRTLDGAGADEEATDGAVEALAVVTVAESALSLVESLEKLTRKAARP